MLRKIRKPKIILTGYITTLRARQNFGGGNVLSGQLILLIIFFGALKIISSVALLFYEGILF